MRVAVLGTGVMGAPAAERKGLRLGALAAVAERMERAVEARHGRKDMAATIHAGR